MEESHQCKNTLTAYISEQIKLETYVFNDLKPKVQYKFLNIHNFFITYKKGRY